jgi:hypothetical protein
MPVTPLHFGVALPVQAIVGKKRFGLWAFGATQVLFDMEPIVRIVFDLEGKLHETTHNPLFGLAYALCAVAMCWRKERYAAVVGAVYGVITHLWLDAIYHADVAEQMAKWGNWESAREAGTDAELICWLGFGAWLLFSGIRSAVVKRRERIAGRVTGSIDSVLR